MATEVAAGATTALTWAALKPGTYLLESGTHPSIQVPMGLIGMLVVTTAPSGTTAGAAYPAVGTALAVPYNAEVPVEFSEIDPVQNRAVNTAVNTAGFNETKVWSGMVGQCGNPNSPVGTVNTCYPPAVNYTPFYYLINGVAFSKSNAAASVFAATAGTTTTGITGTVLVRVVNAGLRLHVPSIVNSLTQGFNGAGAPATVAGFSLIAEDGNVIPGVAPPGATTVPAAPRVKTDVLMVPSKVYL
jgi:FtsP/CotA-like multicopper oxidase with cupredoxin domain